MTVLTPSVKDMQAARAPFDVEAIRADFPILSREVNGKRLVYLDNGASAQKPRLVLDTIQRAYGHEYANVHRGLHYLSNLATAHFEQARETVRRFVNARSDEEIIFTRNATEAINLVASSYGAPHIGEGDEILLTIMEHHSNIVPWHFLRERQGAVLKWAPVSENGEFVLDAFERLISPRTKIIALTHMSNVLGTIVPLKEVVRIAHERGIPVLADGAQGAVHLPVDVQDLDVDFYAFTGHKLYGPTGIGVLYGKKEHLEAMRPYQGGGEMIAWVTTENVAYGKPPHRFEAGTPAIVQAIGLGAAIDYVESVGRERVKVHEDCAARLCHAAPRRAQLAAYLRAHQRQGQHHRLQYGRRPPPRRQHHPRPLWGGGQGRHPLRRAAPCPLWGDLDMPRVLRHVQYDGRGRYSGRGAA